MSQTPPNTAVQKEIQALFDSLIAEGKERGLQATAYHHGKLVLDAVAGTLAPNGPPVNHDTLFPVYSTGKGMTATVIHLLAQRKQLSYEDPIAKYWPEFAKNGKESVTIRHALQHTAGLANLPENLPRSVMNDWDAMCHWFENAAPAHVPGKEINYHAVTYGWILGELAHRVDGRPFTQIVDDEICKPLNITTMYFGIPDSVESRVATIEEAPPEPPKEPKPEMTPLPACILPLGNWMNLLDVRRACFPASNGIMNARAIARHYAALVPGGVDGVEILTPETIAVATDVARRGTGIETVPTQKPLGYGTMGDGKDSGDGLRFSGFGHGGYGGSLGFAYPESGLAYGFTRNRFNEGTTMGKVASEVRRILGVA